MGTVYRAIRVDDHYLKNVAIKLARSGMATGQYLRRFAASARSWQPRPSQHRPFA
jgi:hypothetical protein